MMLSTIVLTSQVNPSDRYHVMGILAPGAPQQNSAHKGSASTPAVTGEEFKHGKVLPVLVNWLKSVILAI